MNIFDGKDGNSNGTEDGHSADIRSEGSFVNIYVGGTFGTAKVTLFRYSTHTGQFEPTAAVWKNANELQQLSLKVTECYRLEISGKDASTDIFAEVA